LEITPNVWNFTKFDSLKNEVFGAPKTAVFERFPRFPREDFPS